MTLYLSKDRITITSPSGVKILDSDTYLPQLVTVEEKSFYYSGIEGYKQNSVLIRAEGYTWDWIRPGPINSVSGISSQSWILDTKIDTSTRDVFIFYKLLSGGVAAQSLPSGWQLLQGTAVLEIYGPQGGTNYYRNTVFPRSYWGMSCLNAAITNTNITISVTGTVAAITNTGGLEGFQNGEAVANHTVREDLNANPVNYDVIGGSQPRKVLLNNSGFIFSIKVCTMDKT